MKKGLAPTEQPLHLSGGQGRNRTTDTRIFKGTPALAQPGHEAHAEREQQSFGAPRSLRKPVRATLRLRSTRNGVRRYRGRLRTRALNSSNELEVPFLVPTSFLSITVFEIRLESLSS